MTTETMMYTSAAQISAELQKSQAELAEASENLRASHAELIQLREQVDILRRKHETEVAGREFLLTERVVPATEGLMALLGPHIQKLIDRQLKGVKPGLTDQDEDHIRDLINDAIEDLDIDNRIDDAICDKAKERVEEFLDDELEDRVREAVGNLSFEVSVS